MDSEEEDDPSLSDAAMSDVPHVGSELVEGNVDDMVRSDSQDLLDLLDGSQVVAYDDCGPMEGEGEEDEKCEEGEKGEEGEEFTAADKALPYVPEEDVAMEIVPNRPNRVKPVGSSSSASSAKPKFHIFDGVPSPVGPSPMNDYEFWDAKNGNPKDAEKEMKELKAKLSALRKQKSSLTLGFQV